MFFSLLSIEWICLWRRALMWVALVIVALYIGLSLGIGA